MKNQPAEVFHPFDFIHDEVVERGWESSDFVAASGAVSHIDRFALEIMFAHLAPGTKNREGLRYNARHAELIGKALGTGGELWMNLQRAYVNSTRRESNG
jgi:hypothetical protein